MTTRTCGDCTACCTNLGVEEIEKPDFEPCRHLCERGCGIYQERPQACMVYQCLWHEGVIPDEEDRPDLLGAVFTASYSQFFGEYVQVTETRAGAIHSDRVRFFIEAIGQRVPVLHIEKARRTLLAGPDEIKDKLHAQLVQMSRKGLPVW